MTEHPSIIRPTLPAHIDSTMLTCFRSCPRKYFLEFVLGLRPPGLSIDLHAGACFATGLEVTYRGIWELGLSLPKALERAHGAFCLAWGEFEIPEYKRTAKTFDRMWEAVMDYFRVYDPKSDHIQPYFAADGKPTFEYTFAIPLEPYLTFDPIRTNMEDRDELQRTHFPEHPSGGPFIYAGRFDMLGSKAGRPVVRDEKTSGRSASGEWSEQWDLRSQFIGYTWACREAGLDLDSVVVRGIAILVKDIKHAEAEKVYSDFMRARWLEQVRRDLWRLRRSYDEGYFDYNLGDACTSYGNCCFATACGAPDDQQAAWLSNFVVRHWNPLQKNPIRVPGEVV